MTRATEWELDVSGSSCSVATGFPFGKLRSRTPSADPQTRSYNNGHNGLDELRGETYARIYSALGLNPHQ